MSSYDAPTGRLCSCWSTRSELAEAMYGYGSSEWAEAYDNDGVCMLPDGHEGLHAFISMDDIAVTLAPNDADDACNSAAPDDVQGDPINE